LLFKCFLSLLNNNYVSKFKVQSSKFKNLNLLIGALFLIVFTSCNHELIVDIEPKPLDQYERTRQIVNEKIKEVKSASSTAILSRSNIDNPCEINSDGCAQWTHSLEIYVDLRECSTSVTDSCLVLAEMLITLCNVDNPVGGSDIEVNFQEMVWGHSTDCIIDSEDHQDDWDCVIEETYLAFVDYMMPVIIELWGGNGDCDSGFDTYLSRYQKELCVYPCIEKWGPWSTVRLVQCGESTACCVIEDLWCIDSEGNIDVTPGHKVQIGECSGGLIPCKVSKDGPWPSTWEDCRPRNCTQPLILN